MGKGEAAKPDFKPTFAPGAGPSCGRSALDTGCRTAEGRSPPCQSLTPEAARSGATGSSVRPSVLNILINYLERRGLVNSKLIKFSDDANLGGFQKTGKGRGNIKGTWMG